MSLVGIQSILRRFELFPDLSELEITQLAKGSKMMALSSNRYISDLHDKRKYAFFLVSGYATLRIKDFPESINLQLFGQNEFIDVSDLFVDRPAEQSLFSVSKVNLLVLDKSCLREILRLNSLAMKRFVKLGVEQTRRLQKAVCDQAKYKVADRIKNFVIENSETMGDSRVYRKPITNAALSQFFGCARTMVSHTIRYLVDEGYLTPSPDGYILSKTLTHSVKTKNVLKRTARQAVLNKK